VKTSILLDAFEDGRTEIMPFVLAAHDVGVRPFEEVKREDRVERAFLPLLDRLGLPELRRWVAESFTTAERSI
jgi:hypothetical protein